jgi:hypothetical protein
MDESGKLIRLYPVPFRLISDEAQFKKWQWITARIKKSPNDHRPESHRIAVDTIVCDEKPLSTREGWRARRVWLEKLPIFEDFAELEAARRIHGTTLGVLRPFNVIGLDVTAAELPNWTDEERKRLVQLQQQGNLFKETETESLATLRKLPFDFHYQYSCIGVNGPTNYRHKIVDWEAGALYWNVRRSYGAKWQTAFRSKLEEELPSKDLMFLMGTIHRFPDQWLIASLLYPPKLSARELRQGSLL